MSTIIDTTLTVESDTITTSLTVDGDTITSTISANPRGPRGYPGTDGQDALIIYNAGAFTGTVTLDFTDGTYQYGYMTADTTFAAPSGGSEGHSMDIAVRWVEGAYTLNFSGIKMNSDASALLPITLEAWRCYLIRLTHIGGGWTLISIEGPNLESVD